MAYLEKLRADKIHESCVILQAHIRGWSQQRQYKRVCVAVKGIQRYTRGLLARRLISMY